MTINLIALIISIINTILLVVLIYKGQQVGENNFPFVKPRQQEAEPKELESGPFESSGDGITDA